ncbi:sensor histidine kinase [Cognatiluteimonas weifangensis]|uniref:sensor histidine kinase n=1 Tax=Cognatiluteimonas weifangensis TaxID=2303539 RepID=UPI0013144E5D|nr:HAMP domain-containing sensor histidine kinase [Luteimonas weifangensis]
MALGTAILDLQQRWLQLEPALAQRFGVEPQALHGQPAAQVFDPDAAAALHAYLAAVAAGTAVPATAPRVRARADGAALTLAATLVRDAAGVPCVLALRLYGAAEPPGAAAPAAEPALRQALAAAEAREQALLRQQEVFAYGISHDLRAPLRAVETFSALLQRQATALDADGRDHLQRIRAAAARMGGLIEALLDLSRVERAALVPAVVDLSLLAELAVADLQDAESGRAVALTVAPGLFAHGDERQLRMLLTQLLRNAWRFSGACEQVRIEVDGERVGDTLRVAVRDHGCGFDMRYADKLFEPFQRLHGSEQGSGHGIGLAIARRVVERHGGRLWAESDPGAGSTFHFELPAAPATDESPA